MTMELRFLALAVCLLAVPPMFCFGFCPGGQNETYCPERYGCVASGQNCSNGTISSCVNETTLCKENGTEHCVDTRNYTCGNFSSNGTISSCVNETALCKENGTAYCVDIRNYTCGNFSCQNSTKYCPESESCIQLDERCCTEREKACVEVMEYSNIFKPPSSFDMTCHLLASSVNLSSSNYSYIRRKNILENKMCGNGTFFCPLALGCIPVNKSCRPKTIHTMDDSFDIFESDCEKLNKTFCPLVMSCIPKAENCSYRKLFDWYKNGNVSIDPFGRPCPVNQTFCPLTFGCRVGCDPEDMMGNKSCNGTPGSMMCPKDPLWCRSNDSDCKPRLAPGNFTNITDSSGSGWLEACKYGKLISETFWSKTNECRPLAKKCKGEKKKCRFPPHELCEKLRYFNKTEMLEKKFNHSEVENVTVWLGDCYVIVNFSMMEMCENRSCKIHKLCHLLDDEIKKYDNESVMNRTVSVGHCNITINDSVFEICNISKREKNYSCEIHKLCHLLDDEIKKYNNESVMNRTVSVGHCNITINDSVFEICNISKREKNYSCEIHKLCHLLDDEIEKYDNESVMNRTVSVGHCNITINDSVFEICNISKREKNYSCEIHKLCHLLDDAIEEYNKKNDSDSMMNTTIPVGHCNVTINETVFDICNISKGGKNRSCEIKELCRPIRKQIAKHENGRMLMNSSVRVEHCNVTLNNTILEVCNISLPSPRNYTCDEVHKLCDDLREELDKHKNRSLPLNRTVRVEHCNVTLNETVMKVCNISMPSPENDSCELGKLCPHLKKAEKRGRDAMLNRTMEVRGCNVTVNLTVVELCNISFPKSCDIGDLCPELRQFVSNDTKYSLPRQPVTVAGCKMKLNETVLKEECNISLAELGEYQYKVFFNGFKLSDSLGKSVTHIAVRGLGAGQQAGTWEYKNGRSWTALGAVSPERALVLLTALRLRFIPKHPFWHGLATLKYSPVKNGASGTFVDVSSILEDPRDTLALLQYPPRPVANVTRFTGPVYTVPEDEKTAGFQIGDKIQLNLSYNVLYNISRGDLLHLDEKVVETYNKTAHCFQNAVPAIAIVETGPLEQGEWQIDGRSLRSLKMRSPAVVAPDDALRFVSAEHIFGNWSMKFVPIVYSNSSISVPRQFFDVPAELVYALSGVMWYQNTSDSVREFLFSVLEEMASTRTTYSLENVNGVVDRLESSPQNKSAVKDIAAEAFDAVTLVRPSRPADLPRVLHPNGDLAILNNPTVFSFDVHVVPVNDQPTVSTSRIFLPSIAYNLSVDPNEGQLVSELVKKPLTSDIDGDTLGIAVVQALNSSIGSWYCKSPSGGWVQIIVDNPGYTDKAVGEVEAFVLKPDYKIRFQMHQNDTLWSNLEASKMAKIMYLAWDGADHHAVGLVNVTRPSEESSAYSKKSVTAIVRRLGCDGRAGSKGRMDRCRICGGDGTSCVGCDGVLYSGAVIDDCGNCTGGTTNVTFNAMKDCANECGLSFNDSCGICQRKDNVRNFTDCTGTCFGGAVTNCGVCAGGSSGKPTTYGEDACGVCSGDNSTCVDCAGVPNGGKEVDLCGKCLLPSDPRFNNDCIKLKLNVPESGPSTGGIVVEIQGAGLKSYSTARCQLVNQANNAITEVSGASLANSQGSRVVRFSTPALVVGRYNVLCQFDNEATRHRVEDTSFLVYDKSSISYTSVSPNETSVDSAVAAHISGAGFVNTSDIACVSQEGHVFPATFLDANNVSCSIPGKKTSARLHLAVSFSRADRGVDPAKYVNFTILANASEPLNAIFMENLQGILVTFDVPSKPRAKVSDCSTFIKAANVTSFGSQAVCRFRTPTTMIVVLRGRPTLAPGQTIVFDQQSIEQKFQKVTRLPAIRWKTLTVAGPRNPVIPKAVLTGEPVLGLCAQLKLDGGRSYGGGGRRLEFNWSVAWADENDPSIDSNATADLNNISSYLSSLNSFHPRLLRDAPTIRIGPAYKFTLKVKNFLSQVSENTSIVVQRENKQLPGLTLGPKKKKIKTALGTTLEGRIKLSKCLPTGYKPKVDYSWEIQAVGINLGVVDQPRLRIAPRSLPGGKTYTLTLTATMASDISLSTTATIDLEVVSSPLKAIIKGGDVLVVGEDDTFVLDASPSSDPDGSSDVASYEWLCFVETGGPCFEPDPNNPNIPRRMVIASDRKASINVASKLQTNSNYQFRLLFRKGSRVSKATVTVRVKAGAPPRVLIRPLPSLKVNPTEQLIIGSLVKSKKSISVSWSCVQEEGFGYINLEDKAVLLTPRTKSVIKKANKAAVVASLDLAIAKDKLENGVEYKFRLLSEHEDSSSYSDITVLTNAAPSQGTLEVKPLNGFFGNTTFTFSAAEGWSDSVGDLPLKYQFGYFVRDSKSGKLRKELLGTSIEENFLEVEVLPQGEQASNYSITVFVEVSDIYGAKTEQQAKVYVRSVPIDATAVNKFAEAVDSDFESGDLAKGTAKANAVVNALVSGGAADANTTKALKDFKSGVANKVLSASENGAVQDESGKDVVKGSLLAMTSDCKPNCNPSRVSGVLARFEGSGQQSQSRRRRRAVQEADIQVKTGAQVETVLQIFDNVIDADDYSNSSVQAKADFMSTIRSHEQSLCKGLAINGPGELAKSNLTVIRAVMDTFAAADVELFEAPTSELPEYVKATVLYKLGGALKEQYESWACTADDTCTGACVASAQFGDDLLIPHDPSEKNLTRLSDIVSLRLYNPQTLAEISVSGLASPVVLHFPIENAKSYQNYTKECRIWEDGSKEWQLSGCTYRESDNGSVVYCSCTKLGYITVFRGEEGRPTTPPAPTTAAPTNKTETAIRVEFAFEATYSDVITGNMTKEVFMSYVRTFLASVLNITESRIHDLDIRNGSIIVSFSILPGNTSAEASVSASVLLLERLVKSNSLNLTLQGTGQVLRVIPSSFRIIDTTPTTIPPRSSDDDDLSSGEIAAIAVVCSLVFLIIVGALVYYCLRVRPTRTGKISPKGSRMQLNEQPNNQSPMIDAGTNNNAADLETSEKAV